MKKVILATILSSGLFLAGTAQAEYISPEIEQKLVKICTAIKSNNKMKLHKAIKSTRLNPRAVAKGLVCNGHDPVSFALTNKAVGTAKMMARIGAVDYEAMLAKRY